MFPLFPLFPLFAMDFELNATGIALIACAALGAFAWAFKTKADVQRLMTHRENCITVANILRTHGFNKIPNLLTEYATGNLVGFAHDAKKMAHELNDPKQVELEFAKVFKNVLEAQLSNQTSRQATLDLIKSVTDSTAPKPAATPTPAAAPAA